MQCWPRFEGSRLE